MQYIFKISTTNAVPIDCTIELYDDFLMTVDYIASGKLARYLISTQPLPNTLPEKAPDYPSVCEPSLGDCMSEDSRVYVTDGGLKNYAYCYSGNFETYCEERNSESDSGATTDCYPYPAYEYFSPVYRFERRSDFE